MFALDETLSALSHGQECFGWFLRGKAVWTRYSAKAVGGAGMPGLQEGLLMCVPEILLCRRILG